MDTASGPMKSRSKSLPQNADEVRKHHNDTRIGPLEVHLTERMEILSY